MIDPIYFDLSYLADIKEIWGYTLVAYIAGIPTAVAFARYLFAFEKREAIGASLWDFTILLLGGALTMTLWSSAGDHPLVLYGWAAGNATGTFASMTIKKIMEKRQQSQDNS